MQQKLNRSCAVCGSKNAELFFKKWGVSYYRCRECETIFVYVDEAVLEQYKNDNRLIGFRTGVEYQKEAAERRDIFWDELLDWISFRTYRHKGVNKELDVLDYGNRYQQFVNRIQNSGLCKSYTLKESILLSEFQQEELSKKADVVLYLDKIQQSAHPAEDLREVNARLKEDGLLFLSTRMGTGFDILTLKEHAQIFPYEHVLLPSGKGLELVLNQTGFKVLEYSTPGQMDVGYVRSQVEYIDESNYFFKFLMRNGDTATMREFQRFLQKSGMSSHGHIVAKKVENR